MKELHEEELRVNILEIYRKLCLSPPDMRRELRKSPESRRRPPEPRRRSPETRRRSRDRRLSPETRRRSPDFRRDRRSVFRNYNFVFVAFLSVIMISDIRQLGPLICVVLQGECLPRGICARALVVRFRGN